MAKWIVKAPHPLTPEAKQFLKENYPKMHQKEVWQALNDAFGENYTFWQVTGYAAKHGIRNGHGAAAVSRTEPIGMLKKKEGYTWRKVGPKKWVQEHRRVWIEKNGPVPPGYVLTFADGNRENLDPENIILVTRAEMGLLNRWLKQSKDAEINEAKLNLVRLRIAATKREREMRDVACKKRKTGK